MNNLAQLVYKVPSKHTNDVINELALACSISTSAVRATMKDPKRDMKATVAVMAIRYFNSFYPCSIEDLIETNLDRLAKKRGLVAGPHKVSHNKKTTRGASRLVNQ